MTDTVKEILKPRSIITLALYFTLVYLIVRQMPVPEYLKTIIDFLLGYWFGSRQIKKGETK